MRRHGFRIFSSGWRVVLLFLAIPFLILIEMFNEEA